MILQYCMFQVALWGVHVCVYRGGEERERKYDQLNL